MSSPTGICHDAALLVLGYPKALEAESAPRIVTAAALVDLALQQRIMAVDGAVVVKDHRECVSAALEHLRSLVADNEPAEPAALLEVHAESVYGLVLSELAATDQVLLRPDPKDPAKIRPPKLAPQAEKGAHTAVKSLMMGTAEPEPEVAALTTLLAGAQMLPGMLPFMGRPVLAERITELGGTYEWPGHTGRVLKLVLPHI